MSIQLAVSRACPFLYEPSGIASKGDGWFAFLLPLSTSTPTPSLLLSDWTWPVGGSSNYPHYSGIWVFAPAPPTNLNAFTRSLWASDAGKAFITASSKTSYLAWYDQATLEELGEPNYVSTSIATRLQTTGNTDLPFGGNFSFYIPPGSEIVFDATTDLLTVTAANRYGFNAGASTVYGFSSTLTIGLGAVGAGIIRLSGNLSFLASPEYANIGIHFQYGKSDGSVAFLDYPVFDIPRSLTIAYAVSLDPCAPFDRTRTRFAFASEAGSSGDVHTGPLNSGFATPTGQTLLLTPLTGSALVIQSLYGSNGNSAFTPDGPFQASLSSPASDGSIPLLCGAGGLESVLGYDDMVCDFVAGAAYCPFDPTSTGRISILHPLDDLGGSAITAWVRVMSGDQAVAASYRTQSTQSALFEASVTEGDYLFSSVNRSLLSAPALPALPIAPYGCADTLLTTVPYTAFRAFETRVLAPSRLNHVRMAATASEDREPALTSAATTVQNWVTNAGLVAAATDTELTTIQITSTVDAASVTQIWSISDISTTLQTALAASECFVVATRTTDDDGACLFTTNGSVAFYDWTFAPIVGTTQFLIFKFATDDIQSLASCLSSWTDATAFNADPVETQKRLLTVIDSIQAAASSADNQIATLYTTLWSAISDPGWNGIMTFSVPAVALPDTVSSMLAGQSLSAVALAVQTNDLGTDVGGTASITGSAPFAVVDTETDDAGSSSANGGDYGYCLDQLLARFDNDTLTSFNATGRLEINSLFGVPSALQDAGGGDAATNIISLMGTYQQPTADGSPGYYAFTATGTATFRAAYEYATVTTAAKILNQVEIDSVQFVPVDDTTSRFSLSGSLSFYPPDTGDNGVGEDFPSLYLGPSPTIDLFNFDALDYSDLGIVMVTVTGGAASYTFDVSAVRFPTPSVGLRTGLATDLPLTASGIKAAGSISGLNAISVNVPTSWTVPGDDFDFAIAFNVNLGSPGLQASQTSSLTGSFYLGWTADGSYSLGLLIDGIGQNSSVTLQGVATLSIGAIAIEGLLLTGGASVRTILTLQQCSLRFMGANIPGSAQPFTIPMFGIPFDGTPGLQATTLLWYGAATTAADIAIGGGI
ncbi:hypothetical protein [Niveispirillum irakense]|uniref:hypothetical protein n=1 Tax=Niveispirillum irakense TaxID=34011 RepID=UPI0004211D29|nr:hypothetical protein [Niveispirillum irakense]